MRNERLDHGLLCEHLACPGTRPSGATRAVPASTGYRWHGCFTFDPCAVHVASVPRSRLADDTCKTLGTT